MQDHILSIVWLTPLVGMLIVLLIPSENKQLIRWVANIAAFIGMLVCWPLVTGFDSSISEFQFVERVDTPGYVAPGNRDFIKPVDAINTCRHGKLVCQVEVKRGYDARESIY